MLTIRAWGRVIRGAPTDTTRPFGLFVGRSGFQGWQGIPSRRREAVARAVEHGEHDVPVYLGARVVTIDPGHVIAESETSLLKLTDDAVGIGADGSRATVPVTESGRTLRGGARCISAECDPQIFWHGRVLRRAMQLQFVFPDPRKFGDTNTQAAAATSVEAWSYGNFPAHPVIEIPSAPSSWTVTSPGGEVEVAGATSGVTHRFDMLTGRLLAGGVDETEHVVRGDIWAIPVGESWTHTLSTAGRVITRDTFV